MILEFEAVFPEQLDELVRIRIAAMHDSLTRVGFVVVKPEADGLKLDHLYIEPDYQGRGIGGKVLQTIFSTADQLGLPISVTALRRSDSNSFYQRHGFKYQDETEWDINYIRMPSTH